MKRLLLALVLVALGLVAADRVGVLLAERAVAQELVAGGLSEAPEVDIRSVPFLTQAIRGRYDEVFVRAKNVDAGEVTLSVLEATASGVRLPLSQALSGSVSAVPAEALRATVVVPYDELTRRAEAAELTVEPVGDRLEIEGEVMVLDASLSASATSTVELSEGEILVTAESFDVGSGVINDVITSTLRGVLDFRIPLDQLPYGLVPSGLEVTDRGIVLEAFASDTVLTQP